MPIKALKFAPGIKHDGTPYSQEGGWFDGNLIRFRDGLAETIGGWERVSTNTYLGICRSLWPWVTLGHVYYIAVGTHLKFYVANGGAYYDVTPIRATATLNNPFSTTILSTSVGVADAAHGAAVGDFVTFSGAAAVGGLTLNGEYQVTTVVDANNYTITAASAATSTVAAGGGAAVNAEYQVAIGPEYAVPFSGWGGGTWGSGTWGVGTSASNSLQLWNIAQFGEDLVFGPRGAALYYWDSSAGVTGNRGVLVSSLPGATDVIQVQNHLLVSDNRFVIAFGADPFADPGVMDPMLIRWSDQESAVNWTPAITSKSGELRLAAGSAIVTAVQMRQEIAVFTDTALYSLQYNDAPVLWGANLLETNISILSPNCVAVANNTAFWMGRGKFYAYDGRVTTMPCDVLQYVFDDISYTQADQITAGTNEEFNEIWWFYASEDSQYNDKYVIYNYLENVWYYGSMARSAWIDSGIFDYPIAATTETLGVGANLHNLVYHENVSYDNATGQVQAMQSYVESAPFDIDDGDRFAMITKVLPDITFRNSVNRGPFVTLTLKPLKGSGSGYNDPESVGGDSAANITRTATTPVEQYTNELFLRVRGRQMVLRVESPYSEDAPGTYSGIQWQLGVQRIQLRPSGRRG